jgi:hypothetical protein
MKRCPGCGETLLSAAFSPDKTQYDRLRSRCRACNVRDQTERQRKKAAMIDTIKTELGCVDCGYNLHPAALDFDHLPGSDKVLSISDMVRSRKMSDIETEIAKCEVVCANCHRIRTYERAQRTAS